MVSCSYRRRILICQAFLSFLISLGLWVGGCAKSPQILESTSPKIIFFKTSEFQFYDTGFVKKYPNKTALEIFNAGNLLLDFSVFKNQICLNGQCYSPLSLIRNFFKNDALAGLDFEAILLGKEIFQGKNKIQNAKGFSQKLSFQENVIFYQVSQDKIVFRDEKSGFILEISNL